MRRRQIGGMAAWPGAAAGLVLLGIGFVAVPARGATAAAPPANFNGLWQLDRPRPALRPADGARLPLSVEGRALYERNRAALKAGRDSIDAMHRCLPPGVPRVLTMTAAFKIVQSAGMLAFLFPWNHVSRWVYVGRKHFEALGPAYFGQSVAFWHAAVLVIDTTGFNGETLLDDSGLPHGERLHVVEHLRLLGRDRFRDRITIDDPRMFTRPWDVVLDFHRVAGDRVADDDWCLGASGLLTQSRTGTRESP